ncbi:TetR/AcrR family transcriptional regulator [Cellulomonas marina]|uniref:DNA-binding transcriptional regulator, AcrR family n=1 Tax=Cellulomonas marina TaxID=988821 RepID=A0A1I1A208_9CELL|nr:TetR/AcrR family transcriptional regulator [Cellulomonas marina]GIG30482.1 hypothetical protein Cma02nite_30820 [Cellulomonas marina]SFB31981.1 DNA-binding transcriptional regulator, AcrR family [Cellulomonas marina]
MDALAGTGTDPGTSTSTGTTPGTSTGATAAAPVPTVTGEVPRIRGQRLARDERRTQVLQVAQELFSREGYHHVSMDDIADRACVGKPVLYRHFPSKLDLYLAVVDQRGEELLRTVELALTALGPAPVPADGGRQVVHAVVHAIFAFVDVAGESSSLLFESDVRHDPGVRERVESASLQVAQRVAAALEATASLTPAQARLASVALVALARGAATHRLRSPDGLGPDEAVELVTALSWDGVLGVARPAPSGAVAGVPASTAGALPGAVGAGGQGVQVAG